LFFSVIFLGTISIYSLTVGNLPKSAATAAASADPK